MLKYFLAWFPMVVIAILNGSLRQYGYAPHLDELLAHQISTATAVLLFGLYIWGVTHYWKIGSARQALGIGLMWLGMTVAFEFLFGHYLAGHSWERLLQDYNLLAGRVWALLLVWVAAAPYVFYRIQNRDSQ